MSHSGVRSTSVYISGDLSPSADPSDEILVALKLGQGPPRHNCLLPWISAQVAVDSSKGVTTNLQDTIHPVLDGKHPYDKLIMKYYNMTVIVSRLCGEMVRCKVNISHQEDIASFIDTKTGTCQEFCRWLASPEVTKNGRFDSFSVQASLCIHVG